MILLITHQNVSSQEIEKCREIVKVTIESINAKSSANLEKHLSSNFQIADQKGEIAKIVMKQLFEQLGETITSSEELGSEEIDKNLILTYSISYSKMGQKTATFIFNETNKLEELELFKMEVKTLQSDVKVDSDHGKAKEIPFKLVGKLIGVDVELDGEKKLFIFDSGSPKVILNAAHLNSINKKSLSNSSSATGPISSMDIYRVGSLNFGGLQVIDQDVLTFDLSHVEKEHGVEIHGLIGFELYKGYDVLYDYRNQKLTLINPEYVDEFYRQDSASTIEFVMQSHLPVIDVNIEGEVFRFGLDSGAESNLLDDKHYKYLTPFLNEMDEDTLIGANNQSKLVKKGKIKSLKLADMVFKNSDTVFSQMGQLNLIDEQKIDGLLGYPVLSLQKTLVSHSKKQLVLLK